MPYDDLSTNTGMVLADRHVAVYKNHQYHRAIALPRCSCCSVYAASDSMGTGVCHSTFSEPI